MKIYQLTNTTAYQMMGYVIQTNNGKVIVIDGGNKNQSEELYKTLLKTGTTVDLWILTHIHNDHFESIIEIFNNHDDVKVKEFWRNRNDESLEFMDDRTLTQVERWYNFEENSNICFYSPKVNDIYRIDDIEIEILGVANPEIKTNISNNQSMVFKIREKDFSIIFLGDLGVEGGEKLLVNQGTKLKSDAVQMSHHGQQGVSKNVYEAIGAKYAFWPTPKWLWDNTEYLGGTPGNGSFKTPEVIKWMEELNCVNVTSFYETTLFDTKNLQTTNDKI